ncbi:sialate O-acetylesterase [Mucilaginibacter psychrotolerans]|uniref:9-O-acetylesterase n=1 Tax=Mucilaginibacter psychrotolerans TaxID=1524096 RepID=A0A4Y8SNS5_9SPHI|nr:sialate O-acetylesterase [Mucilaginibacter psychrotolerans]TFF40733.1 9-O-acetylesterase [Mucilaginibacter psychrotolerans]
MKILRALFLTALVATSLRADAKVILSSAFSDNMVLQQKTKAAIWGKAQPGKTVSVTTTWSTKKYSAVAGADGKWKVMLATPSYGGPYDITVSDGDAITLKNVLIGEVWVASGQSNMEFPVSGWSQVVNYQQELADANYPNIRLLQVEHVTSTEPLEDAKITGGGWLACTPQSVAQFSAVAYFFARDIYKKTGIPIGVIYSSWGGTIVEAWTSEGTVKQLPDLAKAYDKMKTLSKEQSLALYNTEAATWQVAIAAKDGGYQNGVAVWAAPTLDATNWKTIQAPGSWESTTLPDFDGIVWLRRKIAIPESWVGKPVQLSLGAIDDNDVTFINGEKIGETNFYAAPRNYVIPADKVKAGEMVIAIRVLDSGGDGGFMAKKGVMAIQGADGQRISLEGPWQYKAAVDFKDLPAPVLNDGPNRPSVLYNAMINPFIQYAVKGAIWYQGESNANRAQQYKELFPALINDWRRDWNNPKMAFYFVQLANFMPVSPQPVASAWAELRDAQAATLALPYTGMAVAIDVGEALDIHPKNKQEVGRRLSLIALAKNYGQAEAYEGPVYKSFKINGDDIDIQFKNADGMKAKDGALTGFAIAGADQKFYWADAVVNGDKVTVSSPNVKNPVAVRYAWANNPVCNLYNAAGLPASPFRTDSWQYSTFGKK